MRRLGHGAGFVLQFRQEHAKMVSTPILLILIKNIASDIARCQAELQLPESYVIDIQYLSGERGPFQPGVDEAKGEYAIQNRPGGRENHSMCINPLNGNILVFGGYGSDRRQDSFNGREFLAG